MIDVVPKKREMDATAHHHHYNETELDLSQLHRSDERETASSFNKSLDFGRHCATPRERKSQSRSNLNRSKDLSESYATMADSFMGESFAYFGECSFAVGNGADSLDYSDSESDMNLERAGRNDLFKKPELDTVDDFEEEELEGQGSDSKDDGDLQE